MEDPWSGGFAVMEDGGVRSVCCVKGCEVIPKKKIVRADGMGDKKEMGAVARVIAVSCLEGGSQLLV